MDVNSLHNTGNVIVELKAPVNNRGNDEIIIRCFSRRDDCSLRQKHIEAALQKSPANICCGTKTATDGSRSAHTGGGTGGALSIHLITF